jgi:hypothetical protein
MVFFASIILFVPVHSGFAQITVLENSSTVLHLKWAIERVDTFSTSESGTGVTELSFPGQNTSVSTAAGRVPGYRLWIGVPSDGDAKISFSPEIVQSLNIKYPLSKREPVETTGITRSSIEWVPEIRYQMLRDMRAVSLVICPVKCNPDGTSMVCTGGELIVKFPENESKVGKLNNSEYEKMLSALLINYETAKRWRRSIAIGKKKTAGIFPLDNRKVYHFRVGDGHTAFNEGTIKENGLIRITGIEIMSNFGITAVSDVQLYSSYKGELPEENSGGIPSGLTEIPLLRVDINGNNLVDSSDYFIAYVTGSSDWVFQNGDFIMNIDRYDDYRHYWLLKGNNGLAVKKMDVLDPVMTPKDTCVNRVCFKEPKAMPIKSEGGLVWVWDSLHDSRRSLKLYLNPGIPGHGNATVCVDGNVNNGILYFSAGNVIKRELKPKETYDITGWDDRKISFEFDAKNKSKDSSNAQIYDICVTFPEKISIEKAVPLTVFSDTSHGLITYRVSGIDSEGTYIFKVPRDEKYITLVDTVRVATSGTFSWTDSGGQGARYVLCCESALRKLPLNEEYTVHNSGSFLVNDLYNSHNRTDYLIISHPDFISAAEKLCEHKKQMGFLNPVIVDINTVYRSFCGGNTDPVAIRNFIEYIHNSGWESGEGLEYVLLLGGAHFDIKKVYSNSKCFIPSYYYEQDEPQDDFFCRINGVPVKTIGRIPCRSLRDADAVVEKIREYELPGTADFGEWRNRAVFVSDDDMQGKIPDNTNHYNYSAGTSEIFRKCWGSADVRVVTLFDYGYDNAGNKPGAAAAIVNQIQNGAGFVCYYGHGSNDLWADEQVMTFNKISLLSNRKKYPLIASFSCSVGKFDQLSPCLSDAFIFAEKAGAIVAIGSSRESYAYENGNLGNLFFSLVLDTVNKVNSMGYMLTLAKLLVGASSYKYIYFGDPSVKLVHSVNKIDLDVTDSAGIQISEIKARQKILVSGRVGTGGTLAESFGTSQEPAFVQIGLFNPPAIESRKDGVGREVKYQLPGKPIFLGKVQVKNGRFSQLLKTGENVPFNKPGIRLTAYAWRERTGDAGVGYRDDLICNGSENSPHDDTAGPQILVRPLYADSRMSKPAISFSDRITSSLPMQCEIVIKDESGIDVTGTGPDEGLSYSIQDVSDRQNINSQFQFSEGDFRTGSVVLNFDKSNLTPGEFTLNIWATDLLGNRAIAAFDLNILIDSEISLDRVFNYPNPMTIGGGTRFYFYHSNTSQESGMEMRAVIRIYSLTGKLLRVIKDAENGLTWDGRDQYGRILSPDVYLYQVQVYSSGLKKSSKSKICKLVIHPPHK